MTEVGHVTLLGSEMLTWSDLDGDVGGFGGLLAPHLLHDFGGPRGRALVAGPTTAAVVIDVATQFEMTDVLVRSYADAQTLRDALPESVGVFCGPLDRMVREGRVYDAVVAVAGTDRLHSAEEDTPARGAVLGDLAALVGPGGELFVSVGNPVGIDRLLSLDTGSRHGNADWPDGFQPAPGTVVRTPTIDETVALLEEQGLARVETWHCHGRRSDPLVAAPAVTFADRALDSVLAREVARAYDVADPSAPAIKDPAVVVREMVRAGLGAATAPLAVLHLRRGGAASDPADALLVQEPVHEGSPAVAYRLDPNGSGWTRVLLGEPATYQVGSGLTRNSAALNGAVAAGPTLAEAIEACCAEHDASGAGVLVRRYRDWLGPAADSVVAVDQVPVTPAHLAVDGDRLLVIDSGWVAREPARRDVVLVRGLLDVAADLLARGVRHPWSPAASARTIAVSLAAAAGIEVLPDGTGDALLDEVLALDACLRPVGETPNYDAAGNADRLSYAELAELARSTAERAAQSDEHVFWLLRRLQGRQRALRATRARARAAEESREMWIGRRVMVLRSLKRRWDRRQEAKLNGPFGEWTDPATRPPNPEDDPDALVTIERQFLPPGYRGDDRIEVIPDEEEED